MFDFIRKHTKVTMALLFLLIVPSFILVGMNNNPTSDNGGVVAKVDGREITKPEWDMVHQQEVDRMRASMPTLDAKLLDSPEARYATLERMVRDRVVVAAVNVSNEEVARELQKIPEIAALRTPDGRLDTARYRQLLAGQGMSAEVFEANMRNELQNRRALGDFRSTELKLNAPADTALNAYFEKREVQLARFNTADYAAKLNPTDADLEQFYKANGPLFQAPEQATIEYVVLDMAGVGKTVTVNEADLKTYYEQNVQRMSGAEERRASHILINAPKTAPAADREKAKAKAAELLAAVKKAPDTFADLARKNSQDSGSAPNGGDLDFFARGAMVKPFEDAAFAMKKGDISDVIESDFGYHIIKLTDIKAPKQRTFEEMRPELEVAMKKQEAQKKFAEAADTFTNTVYEQAESLKPVADRLKLEIRTAQRVSPQPVAGATGPLANPKFLAALFTPDAIEKKRNTEAIEVGPSQLASGRIVQYAAAHTQAFADVKDQVRQRWMAQRGAEEARNDGEAKLVAWKAAPATAALAAPLLVSRDQPQKLSPQIVDAVLRADAGTLPALAGVDLGAEGYAIFRIAKILPRDVPPEAAAKQAYDQYAQAWAAAESQAYYNRLKERFKVEIKVPKPALAKAGSEQVVTQ